MSKVAVIGTTTWGTTLAVLLARKGLAVYLWARSEAEAQGLNAAREHRERLPGVSFPSTLVVTADLEEGLKEAALVILAVPSQGMRENVQRLRRGLGASSLVLSAAKGLEIGSGARMVEVIAEELGATVLGRMAVLSGPNLAKEIAQGLPATTVVAAFRPEVAERVQSLMMTRRLRIYTHSDVIGVELGGALKNIIAIGAGACDGIGYGDNAKAAFITRGLAEITRLGVAAGANPLTFAGLAGVGDLLVTCSSPLSRNRYVGQELARGRPLAVILAELKQVAEGVPTTKAARALAQRLGVEMPITEQTYRVLFEGVGLQEAVAGLMEREAKHELAGMELRSRST